MMPIQEPGAVKKPLRRAPTAQRGPPGIKRLGPGSIITRRAPPPGRQATPGATPGVQRLAPGQGIITRRAAPPGAAQGGTAPGGQRFVSGSTPILRMAPPGPQITPPAQGGGDVGTQPAFAPGGSPFNTGGSQTGAPPGTQQFTGQMMNSRMAPPGPRIAPPARGGGDVGTQPRIAPPGPQIAPPQGGAPGGVPSQNFGPGRNLINQQLGVGNSGLGGFSPGGDVGGQRGAIGQALGNLGFTPGQDTSQARGFAGQALSNLQNAPSRQDLAQQSFDQLQSASEPAFQQRLRGVGQKAAALGRIGSGVTTSELGDVTLRREKNLGNLRSQLGTQAAGLQLNDLLGKQGAALGQAGALQGMDLGQLGARQGILGQQLGAQGQFFGQDLGRFGANLGAQGQGFNQNLARTGVAQQQQGFQAGQNQQNNQNRVQQALMQQQFGNQNFQNQLGLNQLLQQIGFGGGQFNPGGQLAQLLSNRAQGTIGGVGQLAQGIAGG